MKLISYTHDTAIRYGVLLDQGVIDMRQCMDNAPTYINDFFAQACGNASGKGNASCNASP
jgi:hypothetical protein